MPRNFSPATAEQVVAAVEAVFVTGKCTGADLVARYCDIPAERATSALKLATDLGLLADSSGTYTATSPLCRVLCSPKETHRAAALRIVLDSYAPFIFFRDRLPASPLASTAAHQTRIALDLDAHRDEIKDTLTSLGTYSQALLEEGGGLYRISGVAPDHQLLALAEAASDAASAEARIREQLSAQVANALSRDQVIVPLADALRRAAGGDPAGAVQAAGNAVESFLIEVGARTGANLTGATGLNAKVDRLVTHGLLPKKVASVGKYLGNIRNAADHGIDSDVGAAWIIRSNSGIEYVFVCCTFIAICRLRELGGPFEI
jgi:hypothetical protein